eukprot:Nk52_evm74s270 gene=Nk52_evmTU74s270
MDLNSTFEVGMGKRDGDMESMVLPESKRVKISNDSEIIAEHEGLSMAVDCTNNIQNAEGKSEDLKGPAVSKKAKNRRRQRENKKKKKAENESMDVDIAEKEVTQSEILYEPIVYIKPFETKSAGELANEHLRFGEEAKPQKSDKDKERFRFGNYNRYYGYRNKGELDEEDPRLSIFKRGYITGKRVLDIGCNVGKLTIDIARTLQPKSILGIDIDHVLIKRARKFASEAKSTGHPSLPARSLGGIVGPGTQFPFNLHFKAENFVYQERKRSDPTFDTIICLSTSKWIHLNWRDEGIKRLFRKVYQSLDRKGGVFIFEPQLLDSYKKKKGVCKVTAENYKNMKLFPNEFSEYLLSPEVGFSSVEQINYNFSDTSEGK